MHGKQDHRSAEMEYSGARLAVNVTFIALVAAGAAFAATGLLAPAIAMAVIGGSVGYSLLYRIPKN